MSDFFERFLEKFEEYRTAQAVLSYFVQFEVRNEAAFQELEEKTKALREAFIEAVRHYAKP